MSNRSVAPATTGKRTWTGIIVAFATMISGSYGTAAGASPSPLSFETAFSEKGEPASLHFVAEYWVGQQSHQLEFWRKGQIKLRRMTDGVIETFVSRAKPADLEYQMTVLDLNKKITTTIDRTNLYRVGNFTDWFDLAHGLKHPLQTYSVTKIAAPVGIDKPIDRCGWYSLQSGGVERLICWSPVFKIPLLIYLRADQAPIWKIKTVSTAAITESVFKINDEGFVRNNANQDIEND